MFLAWNEIRYSKVRYLLIIAVVFLVSYLVFFLMGLAYGLAQANRTSVDKWEADAIVLTDESNTNINISVLPTKWEEEITGGDTAVLSQMPAVIQKKGETEEKINVTFFGIRSDEFVMPNVIEGREFESDGEAVADESIKEEGITIGDSVKISGTEKEVLITGFTNNAKFNVASVFYTNLKTVKELRYGNTNQMDEELVNAIIVRSENGETTSIQTTKEELQVYSISDYISKIPGYNAQVLTFGLMIGFLIIIAAIVIGIFIYVLTIQKTSLFGVMKAQGISSGYIAISVLAQTFLLSSIGVGTGLVATIGTSFILPPSVPYGTNTLYLVVIMILLVAFALLGALFSVKAVVKIDPLEAIG